MRTGITISLNPADQARLEAVLSDRNNPQTHLWRAQIVAWKSQLQEGAAGVFGSGPAATETAPVVDLKLLHAKIGELTLEKDFLSGALSKAGLLSLKR